MSNEGSYSVAHVFRLCASGFGTHMVCVMITRDTVYLLILMYFNFVNFYYRKLGKFKIISFLIFCSDPCSCLSMYICSLTTPACGLGLSKL